VQCHELKITVVHADFCITHGQVVQPQHNWQLALLGTFVLKRCWAPPPPKLPAAMKADTINLPRHCIAVGQVDVVLSNCHAVAGFLSRFEGSSCPAKLLEEITIVDTPGVLSGEKQRIERNYNFIDVCEWFAVRSDLILLLFDPYK
jgi:hypothetical protein